jgi:sugar lactone lactonase YvrE
VIALSELQPLGVGLDRPESVLLTARGEVFVSDHRCGVVQVGLPKVPLNGAPSGFLPNGFALTPQREFLVASLGGGVWRIDRERRVHPFLLEADGEPLAVANFVALDSAGRIWVSVSTRRVPREQGFNPEAADGFIVLVDERGTRIVADGLGFTNECRVDPSGRWLYVNETYGSRQLARFAIEAANHPVRLGAKEVVHRFGDGDFPDGFASDAEGAVWVTCIVSNRVLRIRLDGSCETMIDDSDAALCALAEARFREGTLSRADVDAGFQRSLRNVSSIAFGGADLRTGYLGCLGGDRIATFRSPVAGAPPPHWLF